MSGRIIGIDLGTVNSCVAAVDGGKAVVLSDGNKTTIPSCLAFQKGKEVVGAGARRQLVTDPHNTVIAAKRLLGHPYDSPEVQQARERVPYPIRPSPTGGVLLEVGGRELSPVQVSARVLERIKEVAEEALGEPVGGAVISVPAHFTDVQRKATKQAAEYAGLEVLRLINEPTAAAFAYGYKKGDDFTLAVYDLGGGTFDITVMRMVGDKFEVLGTDGDSYLGGEDFDHAINDWLIGEFEYEFGTEIRQHPSAQLRLKEAAELAKVELSDVDESQIELPYLAKLPDGSQPTFKRTLTRAKLDELAAPIVERTLEMCRRCLEEANVSPSSVNEVLMVGGQSRMPAVRDGVRDYFGREPRRDINPDEVVAMGAALYGYMLVADDLAEEAEEAAEEAFEVAIKKAAVAKHILSEVEKIEESGGVAGAPEKLTELIEQLDDPDLPARMDLPQRRPETGDEAGLSSAIEDLQEEIGHLRGKAQEAIARLAEEIRVEHLDTETRPPATGTGTSEPASLPSLELEPLDASEIEAALPEVPEIEVPTAPSAASVPSAASAPSLEFEFEPESRVLLDVEEIVDLEPDSIPDLDVPTRKPALDTTPVPRRATPELDTTPVPKPAFDSTPVTRRPAEPSIDTTPVPRAERPFDTTPIEKPAVDTTPVQKPDEELGQEPVPHPDADAPTWASLEVERFQQKLAEQLAVAQEAAVEAGEHSEEAQEHANARRVDLVDVTSHALGLAAVSDLFSVLIKQNTPVPAKQERVFTTQQDDQHEVEIRVYQGRSQRASENQMLGTFILTGIAPAPRMIPQIEVTFDIDEDGILSVGARDVESGVAHSLRIEDPLGLQESSLRPEKGDSIDEIDADDLEAELEALAGDQSLDIERDFGDD